MSKERSEPIKPSREEVIEQCEMNRKAFEKMSFDGYVGKEAVLMRNGEYVAMLDTTSDVDTMGMYLYKYAGTFSVEEINPVEVNFGFMNYAFHSS